MKKKTSLRRFIIGLLVGLICLIWVLPICYGILSSLKSEIEIKDLNFHFIPQTWTLENYKYVLTSTGNTPVLKWLVNSLVISTVSAAGSVILLSLAAYGYTRIEWKGRDKVFYCMLALSFFPQIVNIIPLYQIVNMFGWVNKMAAVIVPSLAGVTNMFLMRQFMLGIPKNFDEAARIDGANRLKIIWHVTLPCIMPTVVTMLILNAGKVLSVGFEKIFLLQNSLNLDASRVISTYVYEMGIQGGQFSYSAAIGLFNNVVNVIFIVLVNTLSKKITSVGLW